MTLSNVAAAVSDLQPTAVPEEHGVRSLDADVNEVEEPNRSSDTLA